MLVAIVLLVAGAVVLTVGAESAIRGAGRLAESGRISPFVLGALLFGIDIESLGAAVIAAARGQTSLAAGEAFGTVLFLFSAAFGAALLLARRPVRSPPVDMVLIPGVAIVAAAFALQDRVVTRFEGASLIGVYLVYLGMVLWRGPAAEMRSQEVVREAAEGPRLPPLLLVLAGLGLVYVGASVLVDGGVRVLARTSLTAGFVGGALIGTLASLDEVLLEVLPVLRGMPDLATGNLFGTVAAFTTFVLGLAALVRPLQVDAAAITAFVAAATLYTVVAMSFLLWGRAWRGVGFVIITIYGLWVVYAARL